MQQVPAAFTYIKENDNPFQALWPHRYDYLWADHEDAGKKPAWRTETRHPLSDRLMAQGAYLYGVRFGKETHYVMLDIDWGSPYHPVRHPQQFQRVVDALEPLDLVTGVMCTSSSSGGVHVYFPFDNGVSSWKLAAAATALLENAGFKVAGGKLEVFPNRRIYAVDGFPGLFNGHRLPMQAGSFLLNEDYQPVLGGCDAFVRQWKWAVKRNTLTHIGLEQVLKTERRKCFRLSQKADKFLNDLNTEIEHGWTGSGQTNRLLGRITMRSFIFGHVLYVNEPLEGKALVKDIVNVAKALPGYREFCNHQHDIEQRAEEWARCIEASHYFHFGSQRSLNQKADTEVTEDAFANQPNQKRETDARRRICEAMKKLIKTDQCSAGITERFDKLVCFGMSGATLYKHRDLWHPRYINTSESSLTFISDQKSNDQKSVNDQEVGDDVRDNTFLKRDQESVNDQESDSNTSLKKESKELLRRPAQGSPSLLEMTACNCNQDKHLSLPKRVNYSSAACNTALDKLLADQGRQTMETREGSSFIVQVLKHIRQRAGQPWLRPPD
ncbi:MAG: hypothetical protein AAGA75_23465 [Cyanobacteria bacterium P01_E01_bin.6]